MSSAAVRQKTYRERRAAGEIVLSVRANETRLVHALEEAGLLEPLKADDRDEIETAFQRLIAIFCEDKYEL